jgi:hypothetical protein
MSDAMRLDILAAAMALLIVSTVIDENTRSAREAVPATRGELKDVPLASA